jgi:hypothetical protein
VLSVEGGSGLDMKLRRRSPTPRARASARSSTPDQVLGSEPLVDLELESNESSGYHAGVWPQVESGVGRTGAMLGVPVQPRRACDAPVRTGSGSLAARAWPAGMLDHERPVTTRVSIA